MKKNILIVGGSSGLGHDLAKHYVQEGHVVFITGRHDPELSGATFIELTIDNDNLNQARNTHPVNSNRSTVQLRQD